MAGQADFILKAVPALPAVAALYADVEAIDPDGGGGQFSVVFRARHLQKDRLVALKFFKDDNNDPYRRACFDREGKLLAGLLRDEPLFVQLQEAPSVITERLVHPIGVPYEIVLPYLAFEWLPNGNLEDRCKAPTTGCLDLLERLELFKNAIKCVARLHFLGCAHRDLKPGNFFVGDNRMVKLGDFGTSRLVAPGVPPLNPVYTGPSGDLRYASCEILAGVGADDLGTLRAGDAYSLGAMLFELLTGQRLLSFGLGSLRDTVEFTRYMRAIPPPDRSAAFHTFLERTPRPLPAVRDVNPGIPKCAANHLADLLERLAHFDYRRRVTSVSDVHRILRICQLTLTHEAKARRIICADPNRRAQDSYV